MEATQPEWGGTAGPLSLGVRTRAFLLGSSPILSRRCRPSSTVIFHTSWSRSSSCLSSFTSFLIFTLCNILNDTDVHIRLRLFDLGRLLFLPHSLFPAAHLRLSSSSQSNYEVSHRLSTIATSSGGTDRVLPLKPLIPSWLRQSPRLRMNTSENLSGIMSTSWTMQIRDLPRKKRRLLLTTHKFKTEATHENSTTAL